MNIVKETIYFGDYLLRFRAKLSEKLQLMIVLSLKSVD